MIKLLFIISLLAIYLWCCQTDKGRKLYFLTAIVLSFIRVLKVPVLGDIMPAMPMFGIMLVTETYKSLSALKGWYLYLLAVIVSFLIGLLSTDILRAFSWIGPVWDVMAIATLTPLYIKTYEDLQRFTRCILTVSFIYSFTTILAFWGFYDGVVLLSTTDSDIINQSRIYGISYSNLTQTLSVITICLLPRANINKKVVYLLIVIFSYAAFVTLKRMSFIAIILSLLYFVYVEYKERQYKSVLIIAVLAILASGSDLLMFILDRFDIFSNTTAMTITDHSSQTRVDRINFAMDSFIRSPLWGNGAGYAIYIHNGLMEILANCGLLGIVFIVAQYLKPLRGIFSRNPWSMCTLIFLITGFSLEAAISRPELMCFLGFFIGGYTVSENLHIDYTKQDEQQIKCDYSDI